MATDARVRAVATEFLRLRPVIVGPFLVFTVVVLALSHAPSSQVVAISIAGTVFVSFFLYERNVGAKRVVTAPELRRSLLATLAGITIGCVATGGMMSPLVPMLFAPVGVGFAAFGSDRKSVPILASLMACTALLFAVTGPTTDLIVRDLPRRIILAGAIIDASLLLHAGVASLAAAHRRAAEALALASDEMVRATESRLRSLETLGSRVSHDVKNPLAAVKALVEVMLETADDRAKKRLSVAATEIARIERIIEEYGSLAHPLEIARRRETNVTELAHDLLTVLEARAGRKGISLELVGAGATVFSVDRDRLSDALLNLLLNAIDATSNRGIVTVELSCTSDELVIRVCDTGKGMDAATLAKVGTPFFSRREGGTGLGVALARQVAAQHGGELVFESVVGRGTTATMRIKT